MSAASRRKLASSPSDVSVDQRFGNGATHLGKELPSVQVAQELPPGVAQLLWRQGAANVLEGLLLGLAAKLDVAIQALPLAQDAPQASRHLECKESSFNPFYFKHSCRLRHVSIISIFQMSVNSSKSSGRRLI